MYKVPAHLLVLLLTLPPCGLRALQSFHGVLLYFQPGIMLPEHAAKPQTAEARKTLGHFGLRGMRERTKLIGGKLTVWSELDAGRKWS